MRQTLPDPYLIPPNWFGTFVTPNSFMHATRPAGAMIYKRMHLIFRARINPFNRSRNMVARPWQIVALVLIVLSLILAIMDRQILQPMYLLVLALVVMYGTNTKFPWG
jgi:hypothetical protein